MVLEFCYRWGAVVALAVVLRYGARIFEDKVNEGCSLLKSGTFSIYSSRVITPGGIFAGTVTVRGGKILSLSEGKINSSIQVLDFENAVLMPGLVDIHVHLNEPGREDWEGFTTGTRAAAAGGVTTLVDMPLNSYPATTTKELLREKISAAKGKLTVDVGFWGGLVPENGDDASKLEELLDAGALGLKSFMCPSGINDFGATNESHFETALPVLAKFRRPLLVHCEVPIDEQAEGGAVPEPEGDPKKYAVYAAGRSESWEQEAVRRLLASARGTLPGGSADGARVHIVHLSSSTTMPQIKAAKEAGMPLTVETCPHYLNFADTDVEDGHTEHKCAPPYRSPDNREKLWDALKDGGIDMIASDHSPSPPAMKLVEEGDFLRAWGGISSLQFGLPATWTPGRSHGISLTELAQWWSSRPAALAGLPHKGSIEVGKDADFVVWEPDSTFVVGDDVDIQHRHKQTPYARMTLSGKVIATFVRGRQVYSNGVFSRKPCGIPLLN